MVSFFGSSDEAAFDSQSSSVIKLNNSTVLYLREVNKFLSLVCILREDNFSRQGVIDYNVLCFREAISQVFELRAQAPHRDSLLPESSSCDEDDDDEDVDDDDDQQQRDDEDEEHNNGGGGRRLTMNGLGSGGASTDEGVDRPPPVVSGSSVVSRGRLHRAQPHQPNGRQKLAEGVDSGSDSVLA